MADLGPQLAEYTFSKIHEAKYTAWVHSCIVEVLEKDRAEEEERK